MSDVHQVVHPVETQWHYPILTAAGFEPLTDKQTGLVRKYEYYNAKLKMKISASTGVNADHWTNETTGNWGYWGSLSYHVAEL